MLSSHAIEAPRQLHDRLVGVVLGRCLPSSRAKSAPSDDATARSDLASTPNGGCKRAGRAARARSLICPPCPKPSVWSHLSHSKKVACKLLLIPRTRTHRIVFARVWPSRPARVDINYPRPPCTMSLPPPVTQPTMPPSKGMSVCGRK